MRKITILVSGIVLALAVAGLQTNRASAIETSGIGALPAHPRLDNPRTKSIFVYDIAPDDTITDGVKVVNNTDSTKTLAVYPVDSQASSDGAYACAQKVDPRKEVGSWIKLTQNQVTLQPNSSQIVPFTLTVPKAVKSGEHNGCIVVQDTATPTQKAGNGIVLSFRSALRVAVTTPGALHAELSFIDVKTHNINDKTIGISPILYDKGNVSVNPHIDTKLTGIFGIRHTFSNVAGVFPVFPNIKTRFNFELSKPFWGGWYHRDVVATYQKPLPSGELSNDVTTVNAKDVVVFIAPQPLAMTIEILVALAIVGLIAYVFWRLWLVRRLRSRSTATYTVQQSDTIESIAEHFAISWRQLAKINDIKSPYTLRAGQILKAPSPHVKSNQPQQNQTPPKPDDSDKPDKPADNPPADQPQGPQTPTIG